MDKTKQEAWKDWQAFLKDPKYLKKTKPDKPVGVDGHAQRDDPQWRKDGLEAPPGWRKDGDTFIEE